MGLDWIYRKYRAPYGAKKQCENVSILKVIGRYTTLTICFMSSFSFMLSVVSLYKLYRIVPPLSNLDENDKSSNLKENLVDNEKNYKLKRNLNDNDKSPSLKSG